MNKTSEMSDTEILAAIGEQLAGEQAVVVFNSHNHVIHQNHLATEWLGKPAEALADESCANTEMTFFNRKKIQVPLNDLLFQNHTDRYVGLKSQTGIRWLSWQAIPLERELTTFRALALMDVTDLMQEVFQLNSRAQEADTLDATTGLYNRRYAMQRLGQIHQHAKRYKANFSLALIDIDHFKRLNDTYGHSYGDLVLKKLSSVVQNGVRETDLCARFGGEEFLILMPETNTHDAVVSLDRLRQQISEMRWDRIQRPVTISCGVISWQPNHSVEQLIFLADQRLSTAKKAGRNQVCGDLL